MDYDRVIFYANQELRRDGILERHITVHTSRREGHLLVSTLEEIQERKKHNKELVGCSWISCSSSSEWGPPRTNQTREGKAKATVHQILSIRLEREAPLTHSPIAVELSRQKKIDVAISLTVMHASLKRC